MYIKPLLTVLTWSFQNFWVAFWTLWGLRVHIVLLFSLRIYLKLNISLNVRTVKYVGKIMRYFSYPLIKWNYEELQWCFNNILNIISTQQFQIKQRLLNMVNNVVNDDNKKILSSSDAVEHILVIKNFVFHFKEDPWSIPFL